MKVAILIPAYNAARTVADTLESIQCQTPSGLKALERVVLADDGSKDNTIAVAMATWRQESLSFEVWPNECNMGERATCNGAFRRLMSEGVTWCLVLHADDVAKPHWVESLHAQMSDANPRLTSLCCSWDDWLEDGSIIPGEDNPQREIDVVKGTNEAACGTLRRGCWWHFSGCAMHLPRFFEVGVFDEKMPQLGDLEWVVRCLLAGHDISYLPRTLIKYRMVATSVSSVSFRTNRDMKESAYIYAMHGRDERLAAVMPAYLKTRTKYCARKVLGHLLRRNIHGAISAAGWTMHFSRQYLGRLWQ
jgi:glycosyltransferase involved in cell wall biosynthesis